MLNQTNITHNQILEKLEEFGIEFLNYDILNKKDSINLWIIINDDLCIVIREIISSKQTHCLIGFKNLKTLEFDQELYWPIKLKFINECNGLSNPIKPYNDKVISNLTIDEMFKVVRRMCDI